MKKCLWENIEIYGWEYLENPDDNIGWQPFALQAYHRLRLTVIDCRSFVFAKHIQASFVWERQTIGKTLKSIKITHLLNLCLFI